MTRNAVDENNRFYTSNSHRNNRITKQGSAPSETIEKLHHLLIKCLVCDGRDPDRTKNLFRFSEFRLKIHVPSKENRFKTTFGGHLLVSNVSQIFPIFKTFENADAFNEAG